MNKLPRTISFILALSLLFGCESTYLKTQRLEVLKVSYQKSLAFLHAELRRNNAIAKFKINAPNNSAKQVANRYISEVGAHLTDGSGQFYTLIISHKEADRCQTKAGLIPGTSFESCGGFTKMTIRVRILDQNGVELMAGRHRMYKPTERLWESRYADGVIMALANIPEDSISE